MACRGAVQSAIGDGELQHRGEKVEQLDGVVDDVAAALGERAPARGHDQRDVRQDVIEAARPYCSAATQSTSKSKSNQNEARLST